MVRERISARNARPGRALVVLEIGLERYDERGGECRRQGAKYPLQAGLSIASQGFDPICSLVHRAPNPSCEIA